jgi:hypothetical protein
VSTISPVCWRVNNVSASVGSVLKPASFDASLGIISAAYVEDATDPEWKNDHVEDGQIGIDPDAVADILKRWRSYSLLSPSVRMGCNLSELPRT